MTEVINAPITTKNHEFHTTVLDTIIWEATVDHGLAKQQNKWVYRGYTQILILRSRNTQNSPRKKVSIRRILAYGRDIHH